METKDEKRPGFEDFSEFVDYHKRFINHMKEYHGEKSIKADNGQRSRIDTSKQLNLARAYVQSTIELISRFPKETEKAVEIYLLSIESDLKEPLAFNRSCQPTHLGVVGRPLHLSAVGLDKCRSIGIDNRKCSYLGEIDLLEGVSVSLNPQKTDCKVSYKGKSINLRVGTDRLTNIFPLNEIEKKLHQSDDKEDVYALDIGCAQSLPSLYKQRAYGENYPYNLYKHLSELMGVLTLSPKLLTPTRVRLLILIGLFIAGPFLSKCPAGPKTMSIGSSLAVWMSGAPGPVNPMFHKLNEQTSNARKERYSDVKKGFIIDAPEPSANKHNKLYRFMDLGKKIHKQESSSQYSIEKLRFARMQSQNKAFTNMEGRVEKDKENKKGKEVKDIKDEDNEIIRPDASYFLLPEILGDIDIPSGYAPAGWMRRISYSFNELLTFQEVTEPEFEEIRWDFISKLVVGGYRWYENNKSVGTNLLKYLQSYTSIHPVLVGLDDTLQYFNTNVEFRRMTDLPALTSMLPLFDLEKAEFKTAVDMESQITSKLKSACDDISPGLFNFGVSLQKRIGDSPTQVSAWQAQNYFLCFCNWINRFASVGYGHADKLTAIGIFMTPLAIEKKEKADPKAPVFEEQLYKAMFDVTPDLDFTSIGAQLKLTKQTSAGPGYSMKVHSEQGFRIADFESTNITGVSSNKKPGVAMAAASTITSEELYDTAGGPLAPYGSGRRDDTTKSVRIIYVMNFTALSVQAQTTAALGKYERDGINKHIYMNANSKGDIPNTVNMYKIALGCASTAPYSEVKNLPFSTKVPFNSERPLPVGSKRAGGSAMELMGAEDYPKWDQHVRGALRALYRHAYKGTGPFKNSTLVERSRFLRVYKRFIDGVALFIIQEGDSDSFFLMVSSLTSGDFWTTKLNSFVHDELQKFLKRVLLAYAESTFDGGTDWAKQFMNEDVDFIEIPKADVPIIVSIDDVYRRVFGDDGLLKQIIMGLKLKSPEEQIVAYRKITEIIKFCNNVAGFGLSDEDVFQAVNQGVMLNYYYYGGSLFRRQRPVYAQEGRSRPLPYELGASATGMLVSGQSTVGFKVNQSLNLSAPEPESSLGMRTHIAPTTFIMPKENNEFVKLLPLLHPAYAFYSLTKMLPTKLTVTEYDEAKDNDLADTFFEGDKYVSVKLANRPVSFHTVRGETTRRTVPEVVADATEHFVNSQPDRLHVSKIPGFVDDMKGALFSDSISRAFPKKSFESLRSNDLIKKTLKHRAISNVRDVSTVVTYQRKFDIGFSSSINITDNILAYIVCHKGRIFIERSRGGFPSYEVGWMPRFPVMQGVCDLYLALQMIFGVSTVEKPKQSVIFSTGHFSLDALTDKQIVGKVMRFPTPDEKLEAFRGMGFLPSEARENLNNLNKARLNVLNDTVKKWGTTSSVPEIHLATDRLSQLLLEQELNFNWGNLDDVSEESKREVRAIFTEVSTGITFNDVTTTLYSILKRGTNFLSILDSDVPIRIGRIWEITVDPR